jgi:hypothetical protein
MKVIRIITYETSDPKVLADQMNYSLADGDCKFISAVRVNIKTIHSDIDHERFGSLRPKQDVKV